MNAIKKTETATDLQRREQLRVMITASVALSLPAVFNATAALPAANTNSPPNKPLPPAPARVAMAKNRWPREDRSQKEIYRVFGDPLDDSYLVKVETPWTLRLAWKPQLTRNHLWAHKKVAHSLGTVLSQVARAYSIGDIRRLGLDQFGGDHIDRNLRGARRWSLHAWGIAFDFDPAHNRYKWDHRRARFAGPEYRAWWDAWEAAGWYSLGRNHDYDWMHIQALRR